MYHYSRWIVIVFALQLIALGIALLWACCRTPTRTPMRKGNCQRCGQPAWINHCGPVIRQGLVFEGEACASCFEELAIVENRTTRCRGGYAGPVDEPDPTFENIVRAYEDYW